MPLQRQFGFVFSADFKCWRRGKTMSIEGATAHDWATVCLPYKIHSPQYGTTGR